MKGISSKLVLVVLLGCVLGGCGSSSVVRTANTGKSLPPPDTISAKGANGGGSDYRIGAQDLLEITVFGVPDLNRDVRVNSNGQISLPLIGGVQAGGHTIPELETLIAAKLAKTYLQNPQVSVFIKEYTSQRVTLEGALKKPGIYPITGKTTLLQAIATAGGFDRLARHNDVVIFRHVHEKQLAAVFDVDKITTGQNKDPQVYGDDIIIVPESGSKSAWDQFLRSVPAIGLFYVVL